MQVIDYIFYRLYLTYKKANEGPVFSTVLVFLAFIFMYIGLPFGFLGVYLFENDNVFIVIQIIVTTLGIILILRRYDKKKIKSILTKYEYYKCNKRLKTWIIFVGIFIILLGGLFIGILIGKYMILGARAIGEFF